jgi:broad specificity phosphatase PhoE
MIVLCRHASTDANAAAQFLSRGDPPLNERGRVQCAALREVLNAYSFERILASPARRCAETLELAMPSALVEVRAELREIDFGSWEGRTLDELRASEPKQVERRSRDPLHFRPDGGESFADVALRLDGLARELRNGPSTVLVVAHRGSLAVLERLLRGLDVGDRSVAPIENAAMHEVCLPK